MLDRNEEEKKVVFRFEEDDNIEEPKPKKKKEGKPEQWEEMEDIEYWIDYGPFIIIINSRL